MKDCRARLATEHPLASPTPPPARQDLEGSLAGDCHLPAVAVFLPALPTTTTRGLPCAKNGKSLRQVRTLGSSGAWRSVLSAVPEHSDPQASG